MKLSLLQRSCAAVLVAVICSFFGKEASAAERALPIAFTSQDRVLVIAPHPDDETIAVGGILQQAVKAGAKVKVCLLTNGENNEFAFIVYERRIVLKPKEFLRLGEVRRQETLDAMRLIGIPSDDVISLGYPDYGTMEIFLKYWGETKPFRSMLSRVRKVPYADALVPNSPYVGEAILRDMKWVIADFKPTKIFVSHPADVNRDHRAAYTFMQVALWDLEQEGLPVPEVFSYIVHVPGWPIPRGYHPELSKTPPPALEKVGIQWIEQPLDSVQIGKKYDAVLEFPSQIKCAPRYLVTFVRRNELFGNFPPVELPRQLASDVELVWSSVGVNDLQKSRIKSNGTDHFSQLDYARQGNYLVIRIVLKRAIDKDFGLSIFLFGYSPKIPFAEMPKIHILMGLDGFHIKDKKRTVHSKDVLFTSKDKELVFKVPLSLLGDPDRILSTAKTAVYDLTLDETAWRVLELK
jgi:LmbE family N-acetylglucosaminyl deacetylase